MRIGTIIRTKHNISNYPTINGNESQGINTDGDINIPEYEITEVINE